MSKVKVSCLLSNAAVNSIEKAFSVPQGNIKWRERHTLRRMRANLLEKLLIYWVAIRIASSVKSEIDFFFSYPCEIEP